MKRSTGDTNLTCRLLYYYCTRPFQREPHRSRENLSVSDSLHSLCAAYHGKVVRSWRQDKRSNRSSVPPSVPVM